MVDETVEVGDVGESIPFLRMLEFPLSMSGVGEWEEAVE